MSPGGWTNFSITSGNHAGDDEGPVAVNEDVPACTSCKKRKLRCSRETPSCLHCLRLSIDCVYTPRQKPGLKPGALEALTRRVALLEQILLDDAGNVRPQYNPDDDGPLSAERNGRLLPLQHDSPPADASDASGVVHNGPLLAPPPPEHRLSSNATELGDHLTDQRPAENFRKRKYDEPFLTAPVLQFEDIDIAEHLPPQPIMLKLVDYFCISFHHWIPYLHKQRLQDTVSKGGPHGDLDLVLHALVAVGLRHMDRNALFLDEDQIQQQSKISRSIVERFAMMAVSIESLQALIFIVFDYLNDGQTQKAWPLIGSLTRTVDYLQLTTEPSASQFGALMNPLRLVQPTNDWTELEERRRLFWVIFLLDRFCSVSTGWNTSLTSEDVHRRLPADGGYFTREEIVTTPYFGIWNKAAARIGRSLANVPAQYNEDDPAIEQPQGPGASPNSANGFIDASKLGAFAYCVEATESLSQVTTFFLQQRINWQDKEHAVSWLTRFKELDLRLVHWKLFLPPRWKDSNISSDTEVVNMDPNLTLAHITHNTSMILLHHSIAYPARGWNDYVALPKECSAQTCELAAVESSNIVDRFLTHTPIPFVNVQFAFCAFVAAKALLFEHQATRKPIRPEFQRLIRNLWNMSARWGGRSVDPNYDTSTQTCANQPGMYAHHLEYLHELCQQDAKFRFDLYDHSCQKPAPNQHVSPAYSATPHQRSDSFAQDRRRPSFKERHNSFHSSNSPVSPRRVTSNSAMNPPSEVNLDFRSQQGQNQAMKPPLPSPGVPPTFSGQPAPTNFPMHQQNAYNPAVRPSPSNQQFQTMTGTPTNHQNLHDQSLMSLSDTFMDSHFLDMDRVITFEDANFFLPGDAFRWQQ